MTRQAGNKIRYVTVSLYVFGIVFSLFTRQYLFAVVCVFALAMTLLAIWLTRRKIGQIESAQALTASETAPQASTRET